MLTLVCFKSALYISILDRLSLTICEYAWDIFLPYVPPSCHDHKGFRSCWIFPSVDGRQPATNSTDSKTLILYLELALLIHRPSYSISHCHPLRLMSSLLFFGLVSSVF